MTNTNANELQAKIAKLTKEYDLQERAAAKLGDIKHMTIIHGWKSGDKERIVINPKTLDEFKAALLAYPATNENTVIGTARDKYYKELATPYRIDIENPAKASEYNPYEIHVQYMSNETEIQIELPIEFIKDFTNTGERNLTDSEHHYFVGQSYKWLHSYRVRTYNFKAEQMGWYGGNKTLLSESEIAKIIEHLNK